MPTTQFTHLLDAADSAIARALIAVVDAQREARLLADDQTSDDTTRALARMALSTLGRQVDALRAVHITVLV